MQIALIVIAAAAVLSVALLGAAALLIAFLATRAATQAAVQHDTIGSDLARNIMASGQRQSKHNIETLERVAADADVRMTRQRLEHRAAVGGELTEAHASRFDEPGFEVPMGGDNQPLEYSSEVA